VKYCKTRGFVYSEVSVLLARLL